MIVPGDARNDLYVRLVAGTFGRGGRSGNNLELHARLVDARGVTVPVSTRDLRFAHTVYRYRRPTVLIALALVPQGAISTGAGLPPVDEYTSLVYYHDDRPKWQEVFKVRSPR